MRSARKHLTKIAATVALVAGAAGVAGVGTFGAYTDTTTADTVLSSGKVSVLMNGYANGITVTRSNMAAGDVVHVPITIEREAQSLTLGGLTASTTVSGDLAGTLDLTIQTCTAEVPATTGACAGAFTLYSGKANGIGNATNLPVPTDWLTKLNADQKIFVRATLSLPISADNSTQGKSATMTWSLAGTQRTQQTTVATPVQKP